MLLNCVIVSCILLTQKMVLDYFLVVEWYYPYHYGPMISDLVNLNSMLEDVSFIGDKDEATPGIRQVEGEPLRSFEQLLGCLPPSSSYLLPEPYRWLMTSPSSPLIE